MPRVVGTAIGRDSVHIADLSGAPESLWSAVGPVLRGRGRAELDLALTHHRAARAQAQLNSTAAQDNASIKAILKALDHLKPQDRLGRALINEMIRDLGGEAGFRVFQSLRRIAPRQQGREASCIDEF